MARITKPDSRTSAYNIFIGTEDSDDIIGSIRNDRMDGKGGNDVLFGRSGNDTIHGAGGHDHIRGGDGVDILYGDDGSDTIRGGLGNDTIEGNAGNDLLYGEIGGDFIFGDDGNDTVFGGLGNDILEGSAGDDFVNGQEDNDDIWGGGGQDILLGAAGNDSIHGESGNDTIRGGEGNDIIEGNAGDDVMLGNADNDTIDGNDGDDRMAGGDGNDVLNGGLGADVMNGNDGNDTMHGNDGDDRISGAEGSDLLNGGLGADAISGNAGNDTIIGAGTEAELFLTPYTPALYGDKLYGGDGNDNITQFTHATVHGGAGDDSIDAGSFESLYGRVGSQNGDHNVITGGAGNDTIYSGVNSTIHGGLGDDYLNGYRLSDGSSPAVFYGDQGNDTIIGQGFISGGSGRDYLEADGYYYFDITYHHANDTLIGGAGDDTLVGDGGDTMTGGAGSDLFILESTQDLFYNTNGVGSGDAHYTVTDFQIGRDQLEILGYSIARANAASPFVDSRAITQADITNSISHAHTETVNGVVNTTLRFGDYNPITVTLVGVRAADLTLDMFHNIPGIQLTSLEDTLQGTAGDDVLTAGRDYNINRLVPDDQQLIGGGGDDTLTGAAGNDTMSGGLGNDVFVFNPVPEREDQFFTATVARPTNPDGSGMPSYHDVILDFTKGKDVLDIGDVFAFGGPYDGGVKIASQHFTSAMAQQMIDTAVDGRYAGKAAVTMDIYGPDKSTITLVGMRASDLTLDIFKSDSLHT